MYVLVKHIFTCSCGGVQTHDHMGQYRQANSVSYPSADLHANHSYILPSILCMLRMIIMYMVL